MNVSRKIVVLNQRVAILILNTLVLFACLELGARFVFRMRTLLSVAEPRGVQTRKAADYYALQDWSAEYWREWGMTGHVKYRPWVIWTTRPFGGATLNINQEGIRRTAGSVCSTNSYKVFAFGDSTMWRTGVPAWGIIAGRHS